MSKKSKEVLSNEEQEILRLFRQGRVKTISSDEDEMLKEFRSFKHRQEGMERLREVLLLAIELLRKQMPDKKYTSEGHLGLSDDGLDYFNAAAENVGKLTAFLMGERVDAFYEWLKEPKDLWGGCDGEIRHDLPECSEAKYTWEKD